MKVTKQRLGEYVYNATNLATIAGGLLLGHGIGQVASRGNISDWVELTTGLLVTSGSLIYRFRNMEEYDSQISGIKSEISRNEEEISRLESEISGHQKMIRETEQEILRKYARLN